MKTSILRISSIITLIAILSGCGRDLSSNMYTSDSTLSFTMEGVIVAIRPIIIKDADNVADNTGGMLAGGAMGAALGSGAGGGTGTTMTIVGGAIVGGLAGAVLQGKLSEGKGYEYIVKVDTSSLKDGYFDGNKAIRNVLSTAKTTGLITIVQGNDTVLREKQKVYIIYSDNRTRVIAAS